MIVILAANVRILARGLAGKIPQRQAKTHGKRTDLQRVFV
jgi:hypothetical protein